MLSKVLHSKTAGALATWITLFGATFAFLAWATPEWFGNLSWSQLILLGFGASIVTLLSLGAAVALLAHALRLIRPLPQAAGAPSFDEARTREVIRDEIAQAPVLMTGEKWPPEPPTPKPRLRLSKAEQEHVTDRLIRLDDYLSIELPEKLAPLRALLNWQKILKLQGGAGLHEQVEAPRPRLRGLIEEIGQALLPYEAGTAVLELNPMAIKTKALPLWDAMLEFSNVTQILPAGSVNPAPLNLPARNFVSVMGELYGEIDRVRRDISDWRKMIAQGEYS